MRGIQAPELAEAKTFFGKCGRMAKLIAKIILGRAFAHVYDYPYDPRPRSWDAMPCGNVYEKILSRNRDAYFDHIHDCALFMDKFHAIAAEQPGSRMEPFWNNSFFSPLDSVVLYTLVAQRNPAVYMEVGSGNSTKFVRRAIADHGLATRIVSVDPHPRAEIDILCDEVLRIRAETLPVAKFAALKSGDMLFIDNSHRSFQNSDATFFFTEILPNLQSGVIYGIHDIFLPRDYPESWAARCYNEQYLLMAYLLGGAGGDEILFPTAWMSYRSEVEKALLNGRGARAPWGDAALEGGAFWMVKA